jgi:hypothetical protein
MHESHPFTPLLPTGQGNNSNIPECIRTIMHCGFEEYTPAEATYGEAVSAVYRAELRVVGRANCNVLSIREGAFGHFILFKKASSRSDSFLPADVLSVVT